MKIPISKKLLLVLLLTSAIPVIVAGYLGYQSSRNITGIAAAANTEIATLAMSDSMAALSREQEIDLRARTQSVAQDINEILTRVQADTTELAAYATFLYSHPDSFGDYPFPNTYGYAPNGTYGSLEPNDNSWIMISTLGMDANGHVSPELLDEIHLTEFMDLKFRTIAASNPYAVQLYLNTPTQMTRGMPFIDGEYLWVSATEQFDTEVDLPTYDFYFLADAAHNPERHAVWTELYWDPAGLGWMVSSVAPVYRGDELMGVVGIDITLGKMIDEIINVQIEQTGFAFLVSDEGQAIAFPERAADFLGFTGSLEGDFGNDEEFSFFLTESGDAAFREIIGDMLAGATALRQYTLPNRQDDYFFAYHPVALTHWSVGVVVPINEVIAPALNTNAQIDQNMQFTSQNINERSQNFIATFLLIIGGIVLAIIPFSIVFARSISNPIQQLEEGSRRIGSGELSHRIRVRSGDEIEQLAQTFNQMADDLQNKITEIETANTELKKLDGLKSQFISMASHELRTPLIAIQGYVDLLRDGAAGEVNEEQMTMLATVSRNTVRLARIVTELLDLSRIEENKLALNQEDFAVAEVLAEVVQEQKPSLDRRFQTVTLDVEPDLPLLHADRDRVGQVVINLLGNAIKYTPDGGRIAIKAFAEAEHLHLTVQDNGIGIKAEHLEKIFSRFYTAGDVTRHKSGKEAFLAGGTGLGLPIVKGIVEAHGGQVWVESEFGQGSTFHVVLPFAAANTSTPATTTDIFKVATFTAPNGTHALPSQRPPRVLLIDDEADAIALTRRILAEGYDILSASTSGTGLKAAMTEQPDLILLDAWMPGISGYDICKTLKGNANTRHIPIIMVTAAAQQADEARAQAVGANGFITKPFQKADLLQLIEGFRTVSSEQ